MADAITLTLPRESEFQGVAHLVLAGLAIFYQSISVAIYAGLFLLAAHIFAAANVGGILRSAPELLLGAPALWIAMGGALALAWSWVFVSLWGRTPGMAFTGQRLCTLEGRRLGPVVAFARALLAVLSGALGLFGFVLALFDLRGQTLHDKLCRCVAVVD